MLTHTHYIKIARLEMYSVKCHRMNRFNKASEKAFSLLLHTFSQMFRAMGQL